MLFDSWTPDFCLACDKQVHTDADAYCSESCRLADFERTASTLSSPRSSPSPRSASPSLPSTASSSSWGRRDTGFHLSAPFDFTNVQLYGYGSKASSPITSSYTAAPQRSLTPSSSHSSLCSIKSSSSAGDASQLSDKTRQELQAYAVSFEQVRMQRRRSY
ncbi:hypothetical protein B0I35DRAFT_430721 [Stachybotrys elegans]|uniref:Life-span regulatory factor domain-containing protein n=1 Tax=Stachybotrys elegans TaxID=80388 RepID=A0A8K0WRH5_9HYPO|nr:hypothetical protein B0I35DRAFT_430721 [Stachybotrys elegans]